MARRGLIVVLALCLLAQGICYPNRDLRRQSNENDDEEPDSAMITASDEKSVEDNEIVPRNPSIDTDDDDDGFEPMETSSTGTGSNIFTLLRIAGAILPSASNAQILRNIIQQIIKLNQPTIRRQFIDDNEFEIDYNGVEFTPFEKQEENSDESESKSESNESGDTASEESMESLNGNDSKEDSKETDASVDDDDSGYDSDEPPGGGDGQDGGILGLLAGLSGGEDGQSDLGSLLATVSGIVANLSGDGIDLNALIASGIGLFVGLLSEGEENPGAVLASYLLTSLDTISGGGSKNNGAFFGTFLSKLIKGTSAVQSGGDAPSPLYTLKLDILRAFVQFGTSLLGLASSSIFSFSG